MTGVLNIYKQKGMTSHDAVSRVRRILSTREVGHTGTLDPDAEGVLPICVGKATRAAELLASSRKGYRARLRFGMTTDTQDRSGTVLRERPVTHTPIKARDAALSFVGEYDQIPPMYSAIKQGGKKLYELAREGKEVPRKARRITVYQMTVHSVSETEMEFSVLVSKGTYIRTLCADIGERLGCGAVMESLVRTSCGAWFSLENALTLEELEERVQAGRLSDCLTPLDTFFSDYPAMHLNDISSVRVKNGVPIYVNAPEGITYRVYDSEGNLITLSRTEKNEKGRVSLTRIKGFY